MSDIVMALHLLRNRVNEKQPLGIFDVCLLDDAIAEIGRLRKSEAVLEAELKKEKP